MGRILNIRHPDITGQPTTTLTALEPAADTSLAVVNSTGFTTNKYLLIGGYNTPTAEIKLGGTVSSVTVLPTAATSFSHEAGTVVSQIPYNQIEIDYSTDFEGLWNTGIYTTLDDVSAAATWSNLVTTAITPNNSVTTYKDDSTASRTYRWRYKNSTDTVYSEYLSYLLPDGYEEKSVASLIEKALPITNKTLSSDGSGQINKDFCIDQINECLRHVHEERKRWSHDQSFNYVASEITSGINQYSILSGIEHQRGIWNVKINDNYNLEYVDKREWDILTRNWHVGALNGALTSASSTATLFDSSNFEDSGSFDVFVSGTKYTVRYSANNRSTNVLTLSNASTDITTTIPTGYTIWQNASFGVPTHYTIYNRKVLLYPVPGETLQLRNLAYDGYLACQQIDSDGDYVRITNPNIILNWLRWAISEKTGNDTLAAKYEKKFLEGIQAMKNIEVTGQKQYLRPRGWKYRSQYRFRGEEFND